MMKYLLFLLVFTTALFGANPFDEALPPDMNEVLVVVNDSSKYDGDGDGIYYWQEVLTELKTIPGWRYQTRICSVHTKYLYNDVNRPETITMGWLDGYLDTTAAYNYNNNTTPTLTAGFQYILPTISRSYYLAGGYDSIKYVLLVDFPLKTRANSSGTYTTEASSNFQHSPAKSVDVWIELCLYPSLNYVFPLQGFDPRCYWSNRFLDSTISKYTKPFKPNYYYQRGLDYLNPAAQTDDSSKLNVLVCRLGGFNEEDAKIQIRKALKPQGFNVYGDPQFYAVFDARKDESGGANVTGQEMLRDYNSKQKTTLFTDAMEAFGSEKLLYDIYDTLFYNGDTLLSSNILSPFISSTYFGYDGDTTLIGSDSAIFYWSSASYSDNGIPTNIAYSTIMNVANNATSVTNESWNGWCLRDTTLRSGTSDDQTLAVEYLDQRNGMGFTYSLANTNEVGGGSTVAFPYYTLTTNRAKYINAMYTPNTPFAVAAQLGRNKKQLGTNLGLPIGYWRKAIQPNSESLQYNNSTHTSVKYICNVPQGVDSVRLYMSTSIDTIDITYKVTPFTSFSKVLTSATTGVFNKFFVSFVGTDSYRHAHRVYITNTNGKWGETTTKWNSSQWGG